MTFQWGGENILDLIYNYFGISESLNWYSWFVCFYILSILSLPFLHRYILSRFPQLGWLISIAGCYLIEVAILAIPNYSSMPIIFNLFIFVSTFPIVVMGYQCGKWNQEGKLQPWFEGENRLFLALSTVGAVMLLKSFTIRTFGFCIQAFYTPLLIFALVGIFNSFSLTHLSRFLTNVGDLSMYMWFFHAIFFTTTVNGYAKYLVFEPIHNYFYTLFMTFVITYAGSWIFKKTLSPIINKIK